MTHNIDTSNGMQTISVHGGEEPDKGTGASAPSIVMSTTFIADPAVSFSIEDADTEMPYVYTRWGNPTINQLEQKLTLLEEGAAALAFGSGMAAVTAVMFHTLKAGERLVMSDVAYAGASELANDLLPDMGIEVVRVNMADLDAVRNAVTPGTRLVYMETPCNPIMRLTDIEAVVAIAHDVGAQTAVDSTFATPMATQPLKLGVDYVIHSLTKYLGGHGDAVGGAVIGRDKMEISRMRNRVLVHTGGIISPFNAWLILRGLGTFPLRMRAHQENGLKVAQFLEKHPAVTRVLYPGLPSHPQHDLAQRQMRNYSGMLSFQVSDGHQMAQQLASRLQIIHYAVSLGHHRSLVFYMPTDDLLQSSFHLAPNQEADFRRFAGDGFFRFSIGLEDGEDLCRDLAQALA